MDAPLSAARQWLGLLGLIALVVLAVVWVASLAFSGLSQGCGCTTSPGPDTALAIARTVAGVLA